MESQIQEQSSPVTSTPAETSSPTTSSQPVTSSPAVSTPTPSSPLGEVAVAGEAPQYQPNYKFKVLDEEKEIDEWVRGAIKDSETEKKARELFEKAHGLDHVKSRLAKTREEYEALNGDYSGVQENIQTLREHVKNQDFGAFFKALNIPKDMIFQWVAQDLQYKNLPPEEKQRYDEQIELRRETSRLRKENEIFQGQSRESQIQAMEMELEQSLSDPEVNRTMQAFDASRGRVGAFRERLVRELAVIQQASGRRPSATEGLQSLMGLMGKAHGHASTFAPQANTPNQEVPTAKPVISNLKSRASVSPVQKSPTSMTELRANIAKRLKEIGA